MVKMEENYCPVCGEETTTETTSNATNTGRFVKEPEFAKVFPCFLRVFEVKDPPWFEKAFVFCSECSRQLTVVSELEEVMKEVERRLKESEKVVQDKLKSSESKFQSSGVYGRDKRYWKVREQYLSKEANGGTQERDPEPGSSTLASLLTSQQKQPEYVSVEVDPSVAEDFLDEGEIADAYHSSPSGDTQLENPVPRPRRHRAPPKRFNSDAIYQPKKKRREETSIKTGRRITSIPKDVHQTIKVEEGEEQELYQILDEMVCPTAPQHVSAPSSQSSSMTFTTDPLAFAQQLDGGVVEYIKVEVTPEDDTLTSLKASLASSGSQLKEHVSDFNAPTGLLNVPSNSPREDVNLPSLEKVKTRVRKEQPVLPTCDVCADRFAEKSLLDAHIVEVHQSQENYDKLVTEKVKEAELRWGTPGKPVVTHFGIRLDKIGDGKQYQCSACDAIVPITQSNPGTQPRQHVVQYHTDFCKCTVCGKKFGNNTDLQRHVTQVHQGILTTKTKKFECSVCLKPLWSNNQVTFHMWSHYNQEERVAALARGEEKRPKPPKRKIECTKCIKKFFKEEELQRHMNFAHNPSTHQQEIVKVDESTFIFHSVTLSKVFGGEKYKCSACDSILETMKAAKSHGSTSYCPTCEKPFVGKKPREITSGLTTARGGKTGGGRRERSAAYDSK
ncbi:Hypermethylated in cancer 1 protein [Orchesella cincta]|uniref:Hypermethylated in cancer 1 protein n=1 Tax=Orchesella cincta TaxID=48709 RepID=A0A1D2MK42_ORCCI|nr:Hypermethylated in cancer 1 protein [Orchesella cincta]